MRTTYYWRVSKLQYTFFCSPFSVIFLPKFYTLFCKIFTFSVNFTLLGVNFTPFYCKICTCPVKIAPFPVNLHFFCKFYTFLGKICNFLIGYYFRILTSAVTLIRLFLLNKSFFHFNYNRYISGLSCPNI